ncbi:BatD family protein [Rhodanobacter aciditrophus]|uniref:BatD family protein n=1 Tax=Rhodanobacter aciditrophus TaxID=1623218 RepID=A0ABW4AX58_9GAMM
MVVRSRLYPTNPLLLTLLTLLALILWTPLATADEVTAALDKTTVAENEIVKLTVRANFSDTGSGPDFSALKRDFDVLSKSQNSQFSFNLGTNQALSFWVVSLKPKSVGTFEIPPIPVGDQESEPLFLEVRPARQMTDPNGNPLVMLRFKTDELQPYVQQQVILTLELYSAATLQNAKLTTPNHPNLLLERLSDDQIRYEEINGTSYQVLTREYVAFPQRSGTLELINQSVEGTLNTGSGRRLVSVKSTPITLDVLPIPASYGNTNWLPTDAVAVKSQLTTTLTDPRVGDTLNWNISLTAQGVLGEQLPTLSFDSTRAYKLYPTSPVFDSSKSSAGIMGRQSIDIEVVPTQAGELTLPPVTVTYWDPTERAIKTVTANTNTLEVAPLPNSIPQSDSSAPETEPAEVNTPESTAPTQSSQSVAPISLTKTKPPVPSIADPNEPAPMEVVIDTPESQSSWIVWLALGLIGIGAIGLIGAILIYKRKQIDSASNSVPTLQEFAPLTSNSEDAAFQQLLTSCRTNDLGRLRPCLLEWARHRWGDSTIRGVEDIKRLANNPRLTQLLMEAELVMYSNSAAHSWDGQALGDVLVEYATGQSKPSQASQLKTLYPNF